MFVNGQSVPMTDGANTIQIRPKMDFGTRGMCLDALAAVSQESRGKTTTNLHFGAYQVALLQHNIVAWSGPAFAGMACTPENVSRLDPDEPLVVRVLEEIARRNPLGGGEDAEKKDTTNGGEPA